MKFRVFIGLFVLIIHKITAISIIWHLKCKNLVATATSYSHFISKSIYSHVKWLANRYSNFDRNESKSYLPKCAIKRSHNAVFNVPISVWLEKSDKGQYVTVEEEASEKSTIHTVTVSILNQLSARWSLMRWKNGSLS